MIVSSLTYSKFPFTSLLSSYNLREFTVLDVQLDNPACPKDSPAYGLADIEVIRSDTFGVSDDSLIVRSHLGQLLQPGDLVMGYDLRTQALNCPELEKYDVGAGVRVEGSLRTCRTCSW